MFSNIKNNKKIFKCTVFGFTLIELLAVIVILSVILVISVPAVLRVVKNSRVGAFNSDVKLIIKAIDLKSTESSPINPNTITDDNVQSVLGIANENYESIEVYTDDSDELRIIVEGKNKWEGFVACGNSNDLIVVDDIADCNVFPVKPVYTTAQISALITTGYIPIATPAELNNIRNSTANVFGVGTDWENTYTGGLDKNYIQVANIDLNVAPFNTGVGWEPIGSRVYNCIYANQTGTSFQGNYDGGGYKIRNLFINRPTYIYPVGLFSSSTGNFSNIILENADVTGGAGTVNINITPAAALVGQVAGNIINIDNIKISGTVKNVGDVPHKVPGKLGSIVGEVISVDKINITNSYVRGNITSRHNKVGGLIGHAHHYNEALIEDSSYNGNIIVGYNLAGGLVGEFGTGSFAHTLTTIANKLTIKNSNVVGNVTNGVSKSGGIVGKVSFVNQVLIENSNYTGNVESSYQKNGGYIGEVEKVTSLIITNSSVNGDVTGKEGMVGGFIGSLLAVESTLLNNLEYKGEIVGILNGKWGAKRIGGLIGSAGGAKDHFPTPSNITIKNCSVKADIVGASTRVGGLVGAIDTTSVRDDLYNLNIENSSYEGEIHVSNILLSYNGRTSFYLMVGGLVGAATNVTVANSFVNANIDANFDNPICRNIPLIINNHMVGGLVGRVAVSANITNSYYAGNIEIYHNTTLIDPNTYTYINTVVGSTDKTTMSGVYYDSDLINFEDPLAQPKTTLEMKSGVPSAQIYTGWNTDIWDFSSTSSYPILKNN